MAGRDFAVRLLTPRGAGGIAVLGIEGPGRGACARSLLGSGARQGGVVLDPVPRLCWLWLGGEPVDQVLAFERPRAAVVELHLHASEAVLRRLETEVGPLIRPPRDPVQTLLEAARGPAQLALALEQGAALAPWRGDFVTWLAAQRDRAELAAALARSAAAVALATPARAVLCGRKNAGKSTLLNRLLFHERALTGPQPGLTRDPVGETTVLAGYPYELLDTAGEGEPVDDLDARAIARGRAARAGALRLVVVDGTRPVGAIEAALCAEPGPRLVIATRAELPAADWPPDMPPPDLRVCAADAARGGEVRAAVGELLRQRRGLPPAGPAGGVAALTAEQLAALAAAVGE